MFDFMSCSIALGQKSVTTSVLAQEAQIATEMSLSVWRFFYMIIYIL